MGKLAEQVAFLKKYNIRQEDFNTTNLDWHKLEEIYNDYIKRIPILERAAITIAEILRNHKDVHSVRTRVKNPDHLIEKIIRKSVERRVFTKPIEKDTNQVKEIVDQEPTEQKIPEKPVYDTNLVERIEHTNLADSSEQLGTTAKLEEVCKNEFNINLSNYTTLITDLIGIRILHLYKDQALEIDNIIRGIWEPVEMPIIYFRQGDNTELINKELQQYFQLKQHQFGYRSWHYLIRSKITKDEYIAEIQVRTIFEEGWSEIDHQLRYPYHLNNQLLKNHLLLLNRLAGSADEMVNNIRETIGNLEGFEAKELEQQKMIQSLQKKIDKLSKEYQMKDDDYKSLKSELDELRNSQQTISLSSSSLWNSEMNRSTGYTFLAAESPYIIDGGKISIPTSPTTSIDKMTKDIDKVSKYYLDNKK